MALSLDDYEDAKAAQEAASTASSAVAAQDPASAASGAFVPSGNDSKPASGAAIPQLINQAWEGIKPYLNPVHYNAGGPENFDNLDIPTTLAHGLVEGAAGLGLANRIKRELSGEAASARQFKRQNDLVERRIARSEAIDAAAEAANVKAVEQKVSAQAAGNPVPQGRIDPTFAPEPVMGGMPQEPTLAPQPAAPKPQLPQATMAGQQQPQMQYGQTTLNAPTGTPNPLPAGPAAPPVEANAAIAPKPIDAVTQARIDSIAAAERRKDAAERRKDALHELELEEKKLNIEAAKQKSQGQPISQYSNDEKQMNQRSQEAKVNKEIIAANNKPKTNPAVAAEKAAAVAAATPAPIPVVDAAPAPVVTSTSAPVVPSAEKVAEAEKLTKEQKGMKNYLVSQYGGGAEGEGAYRKVIDILGEVPAFEKGQGGGLSPEANNTIKEWRKSNIEGPKVNLTHDMKKVMKGAGGAAILMALPGFAEAAQRKDVGKMSDIFTDFFVLPFAQSREAGMPKAQEEATIAAKFKEASKLGSPYRSVPPPR